MNEFLKISDLILENNNQYIIANKPAGMPSVPDKTGDSNLKNYLEAYCKHDLYIITRTDRPISGITVFAKNTKAATNITEQLKARTLEKSYWALVEGKPKDKEGTLEDYLIKGRSNKSIIGKKEDKNAKLAQLKFKTLLELDNYTLVVIQLITGRFHQIRAQLANYGSIIKGDVKYGARRKNKDRSIHLHASSVAFNHPVTGEKQLYIAAPNKEDGLWKTVIDKIEE